MIMEKLKALSLFFFLSCDHDPFPFTAQSIFSLWGVLIERQMMQTLSFRYIGPELGFPNVISNFLPSHYPHVAKDLLK